MCVMSALQFLPRGDSRILQNWNYIANTARACHKEKGKSLKVRFSHSARTNRRNGCSSRKFFLPNETFCGMRVNHLRVFLCGPSSCGREIKLPFITERSVKNWLRVQIQNHSWVWHFSHSTNDLQAIVLVSICKENTTA
jgi:hypothetical protein